MDNAMTVTIGSLTFDHATYDDRGDVLYLHAGERQEAADSEATPEGRGHRAYDHQRQVAAATRPRHQHHDPRAHRRYARHAR
jgi:hypothetical protein